MKQEINLKETNRANAFNLWIKSPMPMVTFTKTFDVTHLYRLSQRHSIKFNMLLCWCIGKAASGIDEFYILPEQNKLFKYDRLAINVIVSNKENSINSCDIPYTDDIKQFNIDYLTLTHTVRISCKSLSIEGDAMVIGTSAIVKSELECIVNQYNDRFCNPMVMWGKYRKGWFRVTLPISFQFHHVQMDGEHAAKFLVKLQKVIKEIKW